MTTVTFLKCILKALKADKQPIPWPTVASYMSTDIKPDSLRKRFDKTKKELSDMSNGLEGTFTIVHSWLTKY